MARVIVVTEDNDVEIYSDSEDIQVLLVNADDPSMKLPIDNIVNEQYVEEIFGD